MIPRAGELLLAVALLCGCGSPGRPGPVDPPPPGSPTPGSQPPGTASSTAARAEPASGPAAGAAGPDSRTSPPVARQVGVLLPGGGMLTVEVAADPESRRVGLMYRAALPPRGGMLLVYPEPSVQSIWMKNCLIPLDLLWLAEDGGVLAVQEAAPPCAADPCPAWRPDVEALYVLEVPAGTAAREGLRSGSRLQFVSSLPLRGI